MGPLITAQVQGIIEDIRLLEAFVTAPLGLYSDIRMLRQSIPLSEAADLTQDDTQKRRIGYRNLSDDPKRTALDTINHMVVSLNLLCTVKEDSINPLTSEWIDRAYRVLRRTEHKVAGEARAQVVSRVKGLYVIVDPEVTGGRSPIKIAEATLRGGASIIQLRDKRNDSGAVLPVARRIRELCDEHSALFIINDNPILATASGAHGIHLGQTDIPVDEARHALSATQIIGNSNNNMDEVVSSQTASVDYLAVGAIYGTSTMDKSERPTVGTEILGKVKAITSKPVVAIGGIKLGNISEVVAAGADCVCVVTAITLTEDPEQAARDFAKAIRNVK